MDSFYVDLNEMTNKRPRIIRLWLTGAAIFALLFVVSFVILSSRNHKVEWYFVAGGVYLVLYMYFAWTTYKAKLYIQADNFGLEYKFGFLASTVKSIMWQTITKVKIGPTYVSFFKKSGRSRTVSLGWLPYNKVVEIKDNIEKMCESKGILIEKTEFLKEEEKKDKL